MTTFTDELNRRLRAVLSLRVQAPLPSDLPVAIRAREGRYDETLGIQRPEIEIVSTQHPYAAWSYEEPGAWEMLLEDLQAIPDAQDAAVTDHLREAAQRGLDPRVAEILKAGRKDGTSGIIGRTPFQVPNPGAPEPDRDPIAWPPEDGE